MRIRLPHNNWQPRWYQRPFWDYLENGGKNAVVVAHRRWGKDDVLLHRAAVAAHERVGTYWHMLPEAAQAKKAIWNAINPNTGKRRIDEAFPFELRESTNNTEMFIRLKIGSTWQVVGSDNYNSLVGSPPVGVTFSEWSLANPLALAYIDPILIENGGWKAFVYTPRGQNHGLSLLKTAKSTPGWFHTVQTADDTKTLSPEQLDAALATAIGLFEEDAGRAFFDQEYYCSFAAAILGAIYAPWMERAEREGRIGEHVQYDPTLDLYTAWDLGFGDATSIWFWQMARNEVRFVDYYENWGKDVPHYTDKLKEFATERGYTYARHYVPPDAGRKVLEAGGKSVVQQAREEGVTLSVVPSTTGINQRAALRKTLKCAWFNEQRCEKGISALRHYHFEYDEDRKAFSENPYHDWSSHPADAAEIVAQIWRSVVGEPEEDTTGKVREVTPEMWKKLQEERFGKRRARY